VISIFDNTPMKIASVLLALVLWFVIAGEKTSEMGLSVPLELQNFPVDLELTGEPVNTVDVRLRASPSVIQQLGPAEVSAHVNLAGVGEGEQIVHLTAETIRVPFGIRVVRVTPAMITLHLERTLQKDVPVRARLLGRPAAGNEVAEVKTDPAEVRIAGPKTRVREVESAFTEPVSVEAAEATVVEAVNVGLEDPYLRILGSSRVRVTARIREVHNTRILDSVKVAVRGGAAAVQPGAVRIVLSGPEAALKRGTVQSVRAYVSLAGTAPIERVPVSVELEDGLTGVSVVRTEPAEVLVRPLRKRN
jgi:YbbR domain-containing protein